MHPPHQPKPNDFGRKNHSEFRWRPFFFFFGDHLILGGKNVWISDFGRKITLNFGEDIQIFEVLCLKSPPPKFSRSATVHHLRSPLILIITKSPKVWQKKRPNFEWRPFFNFFGPHLKRRPNFGWRSVYVLAVAILPLEAKYPHVILPFGGKIVLTAILPQVPN